MKENDIILNMLANPDFTVTDFLSVGLTGDNTGLRSEEEYLQSEKIRNNKYFADSVTGKFDEAKFHNFYIGAGLFYNQLTTLNYEQSAIDLAMFSKDNMWVSPDKRVVNYQPKLVRLENEHLVTSSLESIGKRGLRTLSQSEIAQTQKIYNIETGEWEDSPNDSFFDNFTEPLVLATYDEDEYDETGNLIHQKGERKLNEEGLPYYETLGGRNIYGKQVLNKFNMLTTDGSFANQFDFFDSDDLEQKSIGGTIMRNAALVGSMFIPYVGPWITGISVATQTAGLLATLGKLFVGNDNDTLNTILGWSKSVNRSAQTEYAALNTWCVENFLNMIGDTIGLLKEQRWIFQSLPKVLGHSQAAKAMSGEKGYNAVVDDVAKKMSKEGAENTTKKLLKNLQTEGYTETNLAELLLIAQNFAKQNKDKAIKYVDDLIKQANNIGSPMSKAYMTALTVQDTYGEAREAGASHVEAALLTLGYAAGEAAILNSELGEWILPELKTDKLKYKAIANALTKDVKEAYGTLAKNGSRQGFVQKMLGIGKKIAESNYAEKTLMGAKTLNVLGAHALTESVEEVSEELLADVAKSTFNIVRWLRGEDGIDLGEWDNMFDRYAMSAAGGFIGGGIASAGTNFRLVRDLASMDRTRAMNELLYMVNNGKEGEFLKSLETMNLGNKNLSAQKIIEKTENGELIYAEGNEKDNQDREIKTIVAGLVKLIKDILESEGAKISTKSLLNKLTLEDLRDVMRLLRYANLLNAKSMGLYLLDFQNIQSDIVKTKSELISLNSSTSDSTEEVSTVEDRRSLLEAKLKELRIKKDAYLTGQIAPEAISDAIFEMNPIISNFLTKTNLKLYAESKLGKKWSAMSDEEKKDITKQYKEYSETSMKNDIHTGARILHNMIELFSPFAKLAQDFATDLQKTQGQAYNRIQKHLEEVLSYRLPEGVDSDEYLLLVLNKLKVLDVEFAGLMGRDFFSNEVKLRLNQVASDATLDPMTRAKIYTNIMFDTLAETLETNVQDFVKLKFIHPEVKGSLLKTMQTARDTLLSYAQNMDPTDPTSFAYDIENDLSISFADKATKIAEKLIELFEKVDKIDSLIEQIKPLSNTPIFDYLNLFLVSTTNSDLKISKHLDKVTDLLNDASNNSSLDEVLIDEQFLEDNEEALLLLDSFIAVINSMKVDNADINNPTGYSKMLNDVYSKQGIKDYVQLTELDSNTADIMLQDALLIKKKLEFVQDIHDINKGLKLKLHDKVNTNKNYILYNTLSTRFVNVLPDDWIGDDAGNSARQVLQSVLDSSVELKKLKLEDLKLTKELRDIVEEEMLKISDTIYDIFERNKSGDNWDPNKLSQILEKFAGMNGFFQKTGGVLNDATKNLDDNSFIWWLASKAVMKLSDFNAAYLKSLTENLAPIPSLEMAVQLGVAAITNMNALNSFVDAYRNVVIKKFNKLSESERINLLENFDSGSTVFANKLLKYFASYDALPQYLNMVFIEGIPGSGKSGGVFNSIKAVMDLINPDWMKNAVYAHVKLKSALDAGQKIGLEEALYFDKASLMKWMSSEWKDVLENAENKDGKVYLYKDSYEFDANGKLQNKWKVNKITNAPKVIFIDEISHYNLQELSLIEQFSKLNGTVVLTAGDLDLDTLTTYLLDSGEELNVTINRNNFIRSPKLGLSLRSLNKLMTHDITMMLASMLNVKDGKSIDSLLFTYLEDDPNHKGLFGVKTTSSLNEETKLTIQTMMETTTDKVGYIYHDENSELYKYLNDKYKDKINFYKDSEAQGLEGQYYIVENDLSYAGGTVSNSRSHLYIRSLYTGISRAELGVLAFVPGNSFGLILSVSSIKDPTYLLETISKDAIKKASNNRKEQLEKLVTKYPGKAINIIEPSTVTTTTPPSVPPKLPPTLPPSVPPVTKIGFGYTNKKEAKNVVDLFNSTLSKMTDPKIINNSTKDSYDFVETKVIKSKASSGETIYTPTAIITDGKVNNIEVPIEELLVNYSLKDGSTGTIAMIYNIGDKLVIDEGGAKSEVVITKAEYITGNDDPKYTITNLDGSNPREIFQSDLQSSFIEYWTAPVTSEQGVSPDNGLENDIKELAEAVTATNETEEEIISGRHIATRLYTFNAFQPSITLEGGKIKYQGSKKAFDARKDNGIGLLHAWGYTLGTDDKAMYQKVIRTLGDIKLRVYHEENNADLLDYLVNDILNLSGGNYKLIYAIKSSAPEEYEGYEQYYSEDELEYIYSKDPNARDPQRKKLVLLVKDGDNTVFELNVASLNSPLTLLQQFDEEGKLIFPQVGGLFLDLLYKGKSQSDALDEIVDLLDGKVPDEQDLINLIKLYKFTSNGIFYLGKFNTAGEFKPANFVLAKCISSGPQLVKLRGKHQLNRGLQYNGGFISLEEFAKNPLFNISSILSSKDHDGKTKAGYPFVLVSTNPNISSDNQLIEEYLKDNPDVRMYYVLPPRAKVSEWLLSQHNNYEEIVRSGGVSRVSSLIGNQFTAYRVLDALIKEGTFESLTSSDGTKEEVLKAIQELNIIEEKWKKENIEFSGEIILGDKTDLEVYEEYLDLCKDLPNAKELARHRAIILEQRKYLELKNNWGKVPITPDISILDALNSYLRGIVWKTFPSKSEDLSKLAEIDKVCESLGLDNILYKTFIGEDMGPHGEFVKIITNTKYGITGVNGTIANFEINAKIDPPSFNSEIFWQYLGEITAAGSRWNETSKGGNVHRTKYFYYDPSDNTWKLTSSYSKKFEDDYLSKGSTTNPKQTVKTKIMSLYAGYFRKGILDESIIDESLDIVSNLRNLATVYNKTKGHYGFEHNGILYLTEYNDDITMNNLLNILQDTITGKDSKGNEYIFLVLTESDARDNITKVLVIQTKYSPYKITPAGFAEVKESDLLLLKTTIENYNKGKKKNALVGTYLSGINTVALLIDFAQLVKSSIDEFGMYGLYNGELIDLMTLASDIEILGDLELLLKVLNYINDDVNLENYTYNVIVKIGSDRMLLLGPNLIQYLEKEEYPTEPIPNRNIFTLTEDYMRQMKLEEVECRPKVWKLITKN